MTAVGGQSKRKKEKNMTSMLLAASLFFAGDSTLDDNGFKHPYRSWGRETGFYMKAVDFEL